MNTAVMNIKIDRDIKKSAQKLAQDLGLSLSALVGVLLRRAVITKTVTLSTFAEEPSDYLINALKKSEADVKAGRVISFNTSSDELKYLDKLIADEKNSRNG